MVVEMKNILHKLEERIDNYKIKKKFYLLYLICVLIPLIFTDSIIVYIVVRSERISMYSEMNNIAEAVRYSLSSQVEQAVRLSKSIYMDREVNDFMDREYKDSYEYVTSYQEFIKHMWSGNIAVLDNIKFTMYCDNDTIVNGGKFAQIEKETDSQWYIDFKKSKASQLLYFDYDTTKWPAVEPKRKMMFIQELDFYNEQREKILLIELDYGGINRYLKQMNYFMDIFICCKGRIVLSNGKYTSVGEEFEEFSDDSQVSYKTQMNIYGADLDICVINSKINGLTEVCRNLPVIFFLVFLNAVFPAIMLRFLHKSFTVRLRILSDTFKNINDETLIGIENVHGEDEIGSLMRSYNKMATRINSLIQIVYKNKIKEQEMTVARQKAELLALHSQINPHFLFNTLESIRMHSILKKEMETADMIEKLAVLQRQYVDWGDDLVEIEKETEFARAYLSIQKYRFGSKLSYEINVDKECKKYIIPKLTVVTFVENACVHGVESKAAPGWVFVRIYIKDVYLYLEIEDTGKGMNEFLMEKLLWKMRNASIGLLHEKERVGVVNACLRLKMETGGETEFELDGEEGSGLIVQIKIPCRCLKCVDETRR